MLMHFQTFGRNCKIKKKIVKKVSINLNNKLLRDGLI